MKNSLYSFIFLSVFCLNAADEIDPQKVVEQAQELVTDEIEETSFLDTQAIKSIQGKIYTCSVCYQEKSLSDFYTTSCHHALCSECKGNWTKNTCSGCNNENPGYRKVFGSEDEVIEKQRLEEQFEKRLEEQRERDQYYSNARLGLSAVITLSTCYVMLSLNDKYPQIFSFPDTVAQYVFNGACSAGYRGYSFLKSFF